MFGPNWSARHRSLSPPDEDPDEVYESRYKFCRADFSYRIVEEVDL